jgi:hypothetical protein
MSKVQQIKEESLSSGKGIIVHIDNFKWLIEQAEKVERYEETLRRIKSRSTSLDRIDIHRIAQEVIKD